MRKILCVPMITLCLLLLGGCGGDEAPVSPAESLREAYQTMDGCTMTACVSGGAGSDDVFTLDCQYVPDGTHTVEIQSPETAAGVRALITAGTMELEYEDVCLPAGTLGDAHISPASCLPYLMDALRSGWLLEENDEVLDGTDCLRLCLDQTGPDDCKLLANIWLRKSDGVPMRGELGADGEILLTAEFQEFAFV